MIITNIWNLIFTHLNVKMQRGRYDLWLVLSAMGLPQKSFWNICPTGVEGNTSLFLLIANKSSCTKSARSVLEYRIKLAIATMM